MPRRGTDGGHFAPAEEASLWTKLRCQKKKTSGFTFDRCWAVLRGNEQRQGVVRTAATPPAKEASLWTVKCAGLCTQDTAPLHAKVASLCLRLSVNCLAAAALGPPLLLPLVEVLFWRCVAFSRAAALICCRASGAAPWVQVPARTGERAAGGRPRGSEGHRAGARGEPRRQVHPRETREAHEGASLFLGLESSHTGENPRK